MLPHSGRLWPASWQGLFFFLKVTFAVKHVFWWFVFKINLKWHQNHELLQEMASWTLWNLGGYSKCLKWSSQNRPVAKRVPMRLQEVSWSEKWATSQLECKSSIKMLILLCVFEGPSQIHYYLHPKLLAHSVNAAQDASMPLYQHRKNPYSWRLFGELLCCVWATHASLNVSPKPKKNHDA